MRTQGVVSLSGVQPGLQSELELACIAEGWSVARQDVDCNCVYVLLLGGDLLSFELVQNFASNSAQSALPTLLLISGERATGLLAALETPVNWVWLVWPAPQGWLGMSLSRALQVGQATSTAMQVATSLQLHTREDWLAVMLDASGLFDLSMTWKAAHADPRYGINK